jgi:hypothetical protein
MTKSDQKGITLSACSCSTALTLGRFPIPKSKGKKKLDARGKRMTTNPYIGSSLDELLEEDGILDEVEAIAFKRVLAWQISFLYLHLFSGGSGS